MADRSNNILSGGTGKPGLQRNSVNDNKLTITCQQAGEADHICDENCGSLKVAGNGNSAGIGGSGQHIVGNLSIQGGNITVSADTGAGIGNGYNSENRQKTIDISGGNIDASSQQGSGIGYGRSDKLTMNLIIRGGRIKAAVEGFGEYNFGIGGGKSSTSSYDANIKITGGSVNATSVKGQPTNEAGEKLYPLKISNVADADVTIDDKTYSSKLKDADNNLYIWLAAGVHTVNGVKANYGISKSGQLLYAPVKDDFIYTAPAGLTYDKTAKTATVSVKENVPYIDKTVIVKYVDSEGNEMTDLPVNAGTYTVKACMDEASDDHIAAEIELGSFTIKQAVFDTSSMEKEKGFPCNDKVQKVSDVGLPEYWNWDSTDAEKSLMAGTTVEAAAIYDGEDKDNYTEESRKITIQITKAHTDADGDGRCDVSDCDAIIDGIGAKLAGYSLSLTGNIGVNFYMELSDQIIADKDAYMQFTLPNGTVTKVPVSAAQTNTTIKEGTTYYRFPCEVSSYEMTQDIKAQMFDGNGNCGKEYTYTVRDYAQYIIKNYSSYVDAYPFAVAMLNYGASSQKYFNKAVDDLANKNLSSYDQEIPNLFNSYINGFVAKKAENGVLGQFAGLSMVLKSETTLNLFYEPKEGVDVSKLKFLVDGKEITPVKRGQYYILSLENIRANELGNSKTFTVTDGTNTLSGDYCAMMYCYQVLQAAKGAYADDLVTLVKAFSDYAYSAQKACQSN